MKPFTVKGFRRASKQKIKSGMPVGYTVGSGRKNKMKMGSRLNFNRKLAEGKMVSLVQFKAEWNGASQIISMIYDDLAHSYKGIVDFHVVDFEEETELSKALGVTEVPTILFFRSGQMIDHAIGLIPKNVLIAKIETALNNTNSK